MLTLKKVTLNLNGRKILDNLNLDFPKSCVSAVIGPNGAGKSTLSYVVMGLSGYRCIEGDILLEGESIGNLDVCGRARRGITLAWQEPARYEGLKVKDFMGAPARGLTIAGIRDALSRAGLAPDEYVDRAVDKTLSGGERKKIELASILSIKPKLVFLDEPDSGIDVESLGKVFEAIEFLKNNGTTVVLITHSRAVLERSEHAFLMCNGRIVNEGSVGKIGEYFERTCLPCQYKNEPDERNR